MDFSKALRTLSSYMDKSNYHISHQTIVLLNRRIRRFYGAYLRMGKTRPAAPELSIDLLASVIVNGIIAGRRTPGQWLEFGNELFLEEFLNDLNS